MPAPIPSATSDASPRLPRILLIDAHIAFRQALAVLLERELRATIMQQTGALLSGAVMMDDADLVIVAGELLEREGVTLATARGSVAARGRLLVLAATEQQTARVAPVETDDTAVLSTAAGLEELLSAVRRLTRARE